jgi:RNA polymerase sigma factor (sigma-70 family)
VERYGTIHFTDKSKPVKIVSLSGSLESSLASQDFDPLQKILMREERELRRREMHQMELLVMEAINSLSPQQRQVFILSEIKKLSDRDIAAQLGIGITSVQTHLALARMKILRIRKNCS